MINLFKALLQNPCIIFQNKNIFLISHMRGNTSLLSHLLGSHPSIEGYYEMHIGYYSWKSLYRQKLVYLQEHSLKKNSRYFFDKILHNDHQVSGELLSRENSKVIVMIREPEQTIKSIVSLYRKIEPSHEYCNIEQASEYYRIRLAEIKKIAQRLEGDFYFVQSNLLKSEPEVTLSKLSNWLGLDSPISTTYNQFKKTGEKRYGDSSENILSGKIQKSVTDYSDLVIDSKILEPLNELYNDVLSVLSS